MKTQLSVYLEPELLRALERLAQKRGVSKSLVAEAAIASLVTPDADERKEAAMTRRLDRLSRQVERLERDLSISIEMLALFVRSWLSQTPPAPEALKAAARAKGRERFEGFVEALGRRLAKGASFPREVLFELPAGDLDDAADPSGGER